MHFKKKKKIILTSSLQEESEVWGFVWSLIASPSTD